MARRADKESGETSQIAVLTFGMTGGGFALLTLILSFFLNPAAAGRVQSLEAASTRLQALLSTPEMRSLRAQAKLSEGQESTKGLLEIVLEACSRRGLEQGNIPASKTTEVPGGAGLRKIEQTINLKPAKMMSILQFLGDIRDSKKTIQIDSVSLLRNTRMQGGEDDSWTATFRMTDYVQTQPQVQAPPAAK